jgi:hypothetical protein
MDCGASARPELGCQECAHGVASAYSSSIMTHSRRSGPKRSAISHSVRSSFCTGLSAGASGKRGVPSAAGCATNTGPLRSVTGPEAEASTLTRPLRDQASAASASAMSSKPSRTSTLHRSRHPNAALLSR